MQIRWEVLRNPIRTEPPIRSFKGLLLFSQPFRKNPRRSVQISNLGCLLDDSNRTSHKNIPKHFSTCVYYMCGRIPMMSFGMENVPTWSDPIECVCVCVCAGACSPTLNLWYLWTHYSWTDSGVRSTPCNAFTWGPFERNLAEMHPTRLPQFSEPIRTPNGFQVIHAEILILVKKHRVLLESLGANKIGCNACITCPARCQV